MALKARLAVRQAAVSASPQMRAALRLLSLSSVDLGAYVAEEVERNPFLEDRSRGPGPNFITEAPASAPSLYAHLLSQLAGAPLSDVDRALALRLIAELDEDGYLRADLQAFAAEIGANAARLALVLDRLRTFTPTGVFARDLRDCLSMQLAARGRLDPVAARVLDHLPCLTRGGAARLALEAGVSEEDVRDVLSELALLSPRPAERFAPTPTPLFAPDVIITPAPGGSWDVTLNAEMLPRLAVDEDYFRRVASHAAGADLAFAESAHTRALWLTRTLRRRARTLLRTAREIVTRQDGFLRLGKEQLRPLSMRTIGDALKLHPSTISRVVANKLVATPQGMIELRAMFCSALAEGAAEIATEAIRHRIKAMIACERAPSDVRSDEAIVTALRENGVHLARRTVAKYREAMHMGSSRQRRWALETAAMR